LAAALQRLELPPPVALRAPTSPKSGARPAGCARMEGGSPKAPKNDWVTTTLSRRALLAQDFSRVRHAVDQPGTA
jgi:hypothetical protein